MCAKMLAFIYFLFEHHSVKTGGVSVDNVFKTCISRQPEKLFKWDKVHWIPGLRFGN